jgi:DNA-binding CsgD family transcriptional regulator
MNASDADVVYVILNKPRPVKARLPAVPSNILPRDRERVLRWISLGASNKTTAQKLSISPRIVRTRVESVFRKLECSTRAAATLKATQLGLLQQLCPLLADRGRRERTANDPKGSLTSKRAHA